MASILVPVLYLTLVVGGLVIFSYFYRRSAAGKRLEPYFPSHPERDAYVTLLQLTNPPTSDALLKAALIRRAMSDVQRVVRIRDDKPALQALLQKGSVGDDIWNSLLEAEKEMEAEVLEVMHEANSFMQGWGQFIFQTAGEMAQNSKTKKMFDELPKLKAEKERIYGLGKKRPIKESTAKSEKSLKPAPKTPEPLPVQEKAPISSPTPSNGHSLSPPSTTTIDAESVTSMSDGEMVSAPATPSKGSQSKKSGKKGKKRK